jgi:hypothetical protein
MKKILPPLALAALSILAACGGDEQAVARLQVEPKTVRLGYPEVQAVRFSWAPAAPLGDNATPTVFVHLLDDKDTVVRTFDHPFPQPWREGVPVEHDVKLYQSALGDPLPAGTYRLTVGLYNAEGKRWALDGLGKDLGRHEYVASEIQVPAENPGPRFAFSKNWLPKEPGGDRQILGRRWLAERSAIRVLDMRSPSTVWMVLRIPEVSGGEKLVLQGDSKIPSLLIGGSCGTVETNISGPGYHEIELALNPPPRPGGFCRIILEPNFQIEPAGTGRPRAVSLENIAWSSTAKARAGGGRRAARRQRQKEQAAGTR